MEDEEWMIYIRKGRFKARDGGYRQYSAHIQYSALATSRGYVGNNIHYLVSDLLALVPELEMEAAERVRSVSVAKVVKMDRPPVAELPPEFGG